MIICCCLAHRVGVDFVPNDTNLGGDLNPRCVLLTGPNMGGKSTILRQVTVIPHALINVHVSVRGWGVRLEGTERGVH